MRYLVAILFVVSLAGCGASAPAAQTSATAAATAEPAVQATPAPAAQSTAATTGANAMTTASGLQYIEVSPGTGEAPQTGDIVSVHYRGTLEDGTVFDSSYDRGQPISFALGTGQVIPGWDEGIALMKQGGKARLVIPPNLAYGSRGAGGGIIPPNATLTFEVELVEIRAGAPSAPTALEESQYTTTASGLKYHDFTVGDGAEATAGRQVVVHYTGWLTDGTKFDSSLDRGQPFDFQLGTGSVIAGWDEGVAGMKVGGKRQLVIPASLGYGDSGAGTIPPGATLIFEVELLDVQ
jgi:peptidylprolyl isomerase